MMAPLTPGTAWTTVSAAAVKKAVTNRAQPRSEGNFMPHHKRLGGANNIPDTIGAHVMFEA